MDSSMKSVTPGMPTNEQLEGQTRNFDEYEVVAETPNGLA